MHTERNVFMNIINAIMDVTMKTKDTVKGRYDMADLCSRPELEITYNGKGNLVKPKTSYVLSKVPHRRAVCQWINDLKLPDRCVSNLERYIDWDQAKLHGMKSHDCHVFMQ